MIGLIPRQADLLRFIAGHIEATGTAPDFQDMSAAIGTSQGGVCRMIAALEQRGRIRRVRRHGRHLPRAIEVIGPVAIPRAPAAPGQPVGAPLHFVAIRP